MNHSILNFLHNENTQNLEYTGKLTFYTETTYTNLMWKLSTGVRHAFTCTKTRTNWMTIM